MRDGSKASSHACHLLCGHLKTTRNTETSPYNAPFCTDRRDICSLLKPSATGYNNTRYSVLLHQTMRPGYPGQYSSQLHCTCGGAMHSSWARKERRLLRAPAGVDAALYVKGCFADGGKKGMEPSKPGGRVIRRGGHSMGGDTGLATAEHGVDA
jgi:hypothetical protein